MSYSSVRLKNPLKLRGQLSRSQWNLHATAAAAAKEATPARRSLLMDSGAGGSRCAPTCLVEVDFVSNLWNLLIPGNDNSAILFVNDLSGNFVLPKDCKLEKEFEKKIGLDCVSDLLARCSDFRRRACIIEQFVASATTPDDVLDGERAFSPFALSGNNNTNNANLGRASTDLMLAISGADHAPFTHPDFSAMLTRALRSVLGQYIDDLKTAVNKAKVHRRSVTDFSDLFVQLEPSMHKVSKFFAPLFGDSATTLSSISPRKTMAERVNFVWYKFIAELNVCADLDEDLPIAQKLYQQLTACLGEYFEGVCQKPHLLDLLFATSFSTKSCSSNSLAGQNLSTTAAASSNERWTRVGSRGSSVDDVESLSSGHHPSYFNGAIVANNNNAGAMIGSFHGGLLPTVRESLASSSSAAAAAAMATTSIGGGGFPFVRLCTDRVRDNLTAAARFADKLYAVDGCASVIPFSKIYNAARKEATKHIGARSPFNFLVSLLEQSTLRYKEQFTEFIYRGIHKDHKLEICLYQIKELYTLRLFADHMAALSSELYADNRYGVYDWQGRLDGALMDHLRNTQTLARRAVSQRTAVRSLRAGASHDVRVVRCADRREDDDEANRTADLGFVTANAHFDDDPVNANEWRVEVPIEGEQPWNFALTCNLEWPLSCIFGHELFDVLNNCLKTCQGLFMLHKFALILRDKHFLPFVDTKEILSRRKRFLARQLLEIITVVYQTVRDNLECIIEKYSALILKARFVEKIDELVYELTAELTRVLNYDDNCVHTAVSTVGMIIDNFYAMEFAASDANASAAGGRAFWRGGRPPRLSNNTPTSSTHSPMYKSQQHDDVFVPSASSYRALLTKQDPDSPCGVVKKEWSRIASSRSLMTINDGSSSTTMATPLSASALLHKKQISKVEKWLKGVLNARMMLCAAAEMAASAIDPNSLNYSIAFQLNTNPSGY